MSILKGASSGALGMMMRGFGIDMTEIENYGNQVGEVVGKIATTLDVIAASTKRIEANQHAIMAALKIPAEVSHDESSEETQDGGRNGGCDNGGDLDANGNEVESEPVGFDGANSGVGQSRDATGNDHSRDRSE